MKPGSANYLLNEGLFYLNEGNIVLAEKKLKKALKKKDNFFQALNALGIVYTYKQEFDKAIGYFRKVLAINPGFIDAHNSLGLIYIEMNNYDAAKENLLIAANHEDYKTPENAFVNLAMLEMKFNHPSLAMRYVEKGIEENKRFAPLYNLKGILLEKEKKYQESLTNFEKAMSLLVAPDINVLINLGRAYSRVGRKIKAMDILEQALANAASPTVRDQIMKEIKNLDEKKE
jgi:Tfp pilus assembly protein PilF